ncbi:uncharacterized protein LOC117653267 [Thrips palmi]|uniref:ATP-dependent DNA helicase n=1 Tax=Thrips palmi TaxID=161013 RepID=A0A6P9A9K2_THRPL|nr:uncharacterized protein LOC117653267 [Thrips palmi]
MTVPYLFDVGSLKQTENTYVRFPFSPGKADLRCPRAHKIDPAEYFQHLLDYEDGRFAKHETFRFFAMNSLMRWNSCTSGSLFVQNNPEFKDISLSALKSMLQKNPVLMKKIMLQSSVLRGSKQYWSVRTKELEDMIEQLGLPTIFLTLSCAHDFHWPELFRLLTGLDDVSELSEKDRRNLLIEYQHRGSPHMHGILWLEGAPDVTNIKTANEEELEQICDYFDNLVSAVNPNPKTENTGLHPCRTLFSDVRGSIEKEKEDLAQLCVRVQRHTKCSTDYCLKGKKRAPKRCRFNFPQKLQERSSIQFDSGTGEPVFVPARNDPLLNKMNPCWLPWWRGNLDISPVLSNANMVHYLSKYVSKCETRSKSLAELFQHVFEDFSESDSVLKFIRRLYIRSFSERDFSAQEVCHILSGRFLYTAGKRNFVHVNLNTNSMWKKVHRVSRYGRTGASVVEKYRTRPPNLEDLSLWEFARTRDVSRKPYSRKAVTNIVQVYPKTRLEPQRENNDNYYRCQTLLHVPWRSDTEFSSQNLTWKEIYENENIHKKVDRLNDLPMIDPIEPNESSDSNTEDDTNDNLEEFMILSRIGPKNNVPEIELGLRQIDSDHDWSSSSNKYKEYGSLDELAKFIDNTKREHKEDDSIAHFNCDDYEFSDEQKAVIEQVNEQISAVLIGETHPIRFTIVQGKAGTGKSVLIRYIKWTAETTLRKRGSVLLVAPTGVTALNIGGETIHTGLKMPKDRNFFGELTGDTLNKFYEKMENVYFLVCDEYSMVGAAMLRYMDLRCRQGKGSDEPFGGLYVYLLGDIRQLPPVIDTPLYRIPERDSYAEQGILLLHDLHKVFFLKRCYRQQDQHFVDMLDRISLGEPTREDYELLTTRFIYPVQDDHDFKDALRLFTTKLLVKTYNYSSLRNLKCPLTDKHVPIAKITAQHNCDIAAKGTVDDAEGLHKELFLGPQCKIMLIYNLWTSKGLCNGAIGYVEDILYREDDEPPTAFPVVVMCKFEDYSGPGIGPMNLVPIPAISKYWTKGFVQCTRVQFPLSVCYSCSVHKAQGLSLAKSVTDIGDDEFALGICYVALSRAKALKGLKLVPFPMERLTKLKNFRDMERKLAFERFLESKK